MHQNFPGQFRQLAPYLAQQGHELVAICSHQRPVALTGRILRYQEPAKPTGLPLGSMIWHEGLERAAAVARLCAQLEAQGWRPDRILAHSGWGETIAIDQVWPNVPQIVWPELWVQPHHGGHGHDPLLPVPGLEEHLAQLGRNALTRTALAKARLWILPTRHQANSFPAVFQGARLQVVHEGIDTALACPDPQASYEVRGIAINRHIPTITFINRNLERLRGFDQFLRSLVVIQREHPTVRALIVGDNEGGYGGAHSSGLPLKQVLLEELAGQLDLERIHFLGRVPHPVLIRLLQAGWVHVYLSYPFVLGWSLLEAMACGCCIVGSEGMPVAEVIKNGQQGLLVPIQDQNNLGQTVLKLLANPTLRNQLGQRARQASMAWDQKITLPRLGALVEAASPLP
ncbi:glycosyltransferase [Cyanobium sp. WAJ14-Wanaka]|uniref:glycosyltransferase n=1 Tax=Cyanobium sp. WAJ14-Wanaka TaxID=2823725 RepID=UPI0020CC866D|nr:glycosyltransferase [Cyanobium sp. WAJ14-Wanaka]